MLSGKNIVLGVTGGIACYKACDIVSRLVKLGANVDVIMTKNATEFVSPKTFESLSHRPVCVDTFQKIENFEIEHISLAKKADLFLIAPATYNVIGKIANGIADDMLSTTIAAAKRAIKVVCPAMNTNMYTNPVCTDNLQKLNELGFVQIEPISGRLACGDIGTGKMQEPSVIVGKVCELLCGKQDLAGKKVLVTCGGTEEAIDAVRVITNHSSGKMGIAICKECKRRGAQVVLVAGKVSVNIPELDKVIRVNTTMEMYNAVLENMTGQDYVIMAAAPSDYRPKQVANNKIKSDNLVLELVKNPDIAAAVGKNKVDGKLVIFSAETENLIANAKGKLEKKHADMVVANDVTKEGAGFNVDSNIVTIIT
ncbi:MAG: bifunctional phosphopantothenoylcysteine decarboxylase/phosphopantothenate--cysteine ligase CoaBC, partial [Clostridia bacterium]|nr:bifunctional phosphopantothenoylcysteine decarboxylase/phosphopantothenate--cysteine ligase CoaBC [Clostridia bacterium]